MSHEGGVDERTRKKSRVKKPSWAGTHASVSLKGGVYSISPEKETRGGRKKSPDQGSKATWHLMCRRSTCPDRGRGGKGTLHEM